MPGAEKGEPDKFYPSGDRSFARVVPADDVQASAAARWTRRLGAGTRVRAGRQVARGGRLVGAVRPAAPGAGLRVVGQDRMDPRASDYRDLARDVAEKHPDAVYFGGGADSNADRLWRDLHAALPDALLIGSHNLLVPAFYRRLGDAGPRTYITSVAQDTANCPRAAGASYATTGASSARPPVPTPRTATLRCRWC